MLQVPKLYVLIQFDICDRHRLIGTTESLRQSFGLLRVNGSSSAPVSGTRKATEGGRRPIRTSLDFLARTVGLV